MDFRRFFVRDYVLITVGINQWEEYTLPFVKSVLKYEPDCPIIVIDNDSDEPYPMDPRWKMVRIPRSCYAAAMNIGIMAANTAEWYVVANNDVLCEGPFIKHLKKLPKYVLHGATIVHNQDARYIEGWIYYLSLPVRRVVGVFDENFQIASYEDLDYSVRATAEGFTLQGADLPFRHLRAETRIKSVGYGEAYMHNQKYFREKHKA